MKLKMIEHNGAVKLIVAGTRQKLIIMEECGCFVVEMVNTSSAPTHMPTPASVAEHVQVEETTDMPAVEGECTIKDTPTQGNNGLFEKLAALRTSLATIGKVPPYLVFHDKTLREMAAKMPANMQAMGNISGVGQAKLEKYGPAFLEAINGVAV